MLQHLGAAGIDDFCNSSSIITQGSPVQQQLIMWNSEDYAITTIVTFLLTVMFLAYLCLCCHVWGLHIRIIHLVRSISGGHSRNQTVVSTRNSVSVTRPVPERYMNNFMTPPPRYSAVNESLPSYSCALQRMLQLVNGPVLMRFHVHIESSLGNNSVFLTCTPSPSNNLHKNDETVVSNFGNQCPPDPSISPVGSTDLTSPSAIIISEVDPPIPGGPEITPGKTEAYSLQPMSSHDSGPDGSAVGNYHESNISTRISLPATPDVNNNNSLPAIIVTPNSPITDQEMVVSPVQYINRSCTGQLPGAGQLPDAASAEVTSATVRLPVLSQYTPTSGIQPCARASAEASDCTTSTRTGEDNLLGVFRHPLHSISAGENGLQDNYIRLLLKGIGGMEQVILAQKCAPSCYEAFWQVPSKDHINSRGLEVLVDGHSVEDIYLEFLNVNRQVVGRAQLFPSPSRSVSVAVQHHSRVPALPLQTSPMTAAANSSPLSLPPPYCP